MKILRTPAVFLLLLLLMYFPSCTSSRVINAAAQPAAPEVYSQLKGKDLTAYGRSFINDKEQLALVSSAAHMGFAFLGKDCQLRVLLPYAEAHNYIQYELDGKYMGKIRINGSDTTALTIHTANEGRHEVWIYKTTEAHTGNIYIEQVAGFDLKPLQRREAPMIEFIGNSITCGAAADPSVVPCGQGDYHDQHNAYYAYGPRVARALNINFMLSSVSGIGVYRNWNSDGPAMPEVYEKTDFQLNGSSWNFSTYSPSIVSIALGTNDLSKGDGIKTRAPFDSAVFVDHYIYFVKLVKSKYPSAKIALLSSPMASGDSRLLLQHCLLAVKASIDGFFPASEPVSLHFFKPMQARGCSGHPNVEDHAILAEELVPFYKRLLEEKK